MPTIYQAFIRRPNLTPAGDIFERKLYITRRLVEKRIEASGAFDGEIFYVASMSCRTIVYKGMLVASQLSSFYLDLTDAKVETALALVHSRFTARIPILPGNARIQTAISSTTVKSIRFAAT